MSSQIFVSGILKRGKGESQDTGDTFEASDLNVCIGAVQGSAAGPKEVAERTMESHDPS